MTSDESIPLIPRPLQLTRTGGESYLSHDMVIVTEDGLSNEASYLATRLRSATNFDFPILNEAPKKGSFIRIKLDESTLDCLGEEGYRLDMLGSPNEVYIDGATATGVFYGIQTWLQLLPPAVFGGSPRRDVAWRYALIKIKDRPRFPWRGVMLDSVRHFFPKSFIKRFIDLLALHKLNVFHWHLTDDQGWRIEIKRYPRLTEIGAWRKESTLGSYFSHAGGDGVPHGGFYTQEDIREIIAYAKDRHVTVVPEIELPGHAQAAIAAYPELGCSGAKAEVSTEWGMHETIFRPSKGTLEFLKNVLSEVVELFPGKYVHIGGDEAVKAQWINDPEVQQIKTELMLPDEAALQSYFIGEISKFLRENNRQLIGWDEILEGGLVEGATVMSWRGVEGGIEAANAGHDVIMTPAEFTYFDFYQSADASREPLAIGGFLPVEKVYQFEPLLEEIRPECLNHVRGLQAQLWSEYLPNERAVEYMAFPRIVALSEVAWSSKEKDWNNFLPRLREHLKRLDVLQVGYRSL